MIALDREIKGSVGIFLLELARMQVWFHARKGNESPKAGSVFWRLSSGKAPVS